MVGKGSMTSGGRNNFGPAGKSISPQESRLNVAPDLSPSALEALTPGLVSQPDFDGFDGASFDSESPFAHESSFGGINNSTSNLAEQMRTLGETPRTGAEQMGITIPRAESSKPRSGTLFNSNDYHQQNRLNELRQNNPEISGQSLSDERSNAITHIPERPAVSSTRLSQESYEHIRIQKTAEQRQKLAQLQNSRKTAVASGGLNLTHNTTAQADKSEQSLVRVALKVLKASLHRSEITAAQLAQNRRAKLAAHKGSFEGGKEKSGYGSVDFAQAESGHEWAGNDMGD